MKLVPKESANSCVLHFLCEAWRSRALWVYQRRCTASQHAKSQFCSLVLKSLLLSLSRVFVTQDCRDHGLKPNLPFTRVDCMAYWPHTGASTSCFVKMKGEIGYYGTTFCLHIKDSNYPKMKAFFSCWDTNITWLQIGLLKSTITLIFLTLRQQKWLTIPYQLPRNYDGYSVS